MNDKTPDFYKQAIYSVFTGVTQIEYPIHPGRHNNLFFVRTSDGDYVAKFNPHDIVLKNCAVSNIAVQYGLSVPSISVAKYRDTIFEYYPLVPGKTLYEHIENGMPEFAVRRAFEDMLTQFVHMGNLSVNKITATKCINAHEVSYTHRKNQKPVLAPLFGAVVYLVNRGKQCNTGLYHTDVIPTNVIVDDRGRLISLLDLDSMVVCNRDVAFCNIMKSWAYLGFCPAELYAKYEYLSQAKINRRKIEALCSAMRVGTGAVRWLRGNKTK